MICQDCGIGMRDERKMMTKGDEMTLTPQADSHAIAGQACPFESSPVSGGSINCHCPLDQIPHSFLGLLQSRLLSVCKQCSGRHCTSYAPKGLLPAPTLGERWKGTGSRQWPHYLPSLPVQPGMVRSHRGRQHQVFFTRRPRKRRGLEHLFPYRNISISYCAQYETHGGKC